MEARAKSIADQYAHGAVALETATMLLSAVNAQLEVARRKHAAEQRRRVTVSIGTANGERS